MFDTSPPSYGTLSLMVDNDGYASPVERVPGYGSRGNSNRADMRVYQRIAERYPRRYRKAMESVAWLDRMVRKYEDKVV